MTETAPKRPDADSPEETHVLDRRHFTAREVGGFALGVVCIMASVFTSVGGGAWWISNSLIGHDYRLTAIEKSVDRIEAALGTKRDREDDQQHAGFTTIPKRAIQ